MGTVTAYLEESEVARLYERRADLASTGASTQDLLARFVAPDPLSGESIPGVSYGGVGQVELVVAPLSGAVPHPSAPWLQEGLERAFHETVAELGPRLTWDRDPSELQGINQWRPRGAVGWTAGASGGPPEVLLENRGSGAVLTYPLNLSFQATWPLDVADKGGYRCAYEQDVAVAVVVFLGYAGQLFSQVDGVGPIGCAIRFGGFDGAVSFRATRGRADLVSSGLAKASDAALSCAASVGELQNSPELVAARLIDPWLVAFYQFGAFWTDVLEERA